MADANLFEVEGRGVVRAVTLASSEEGLRLMVVLSTRGATRRLVFTNPHPLHDLGRLASAEHVWAFANPEPDPGAVVLAFWNGSISEIAAESMEDLDAPGYSTRPEAARPQPAADTRPSVMVGPAGEPPGEAG